MKYIKKLLALALTLAMVVAMAAPAFAATITIDDGDNVTGASYSAYKLLNVTDGGDGKFAYTVNTTYTNVLKAITGKTTDAEIVDYISKLDAAGIRAFADAVYAQVKSMDADATAENNVFSNVEQGYWLIVETKTGDTPDTMGDDTYSLVMLDTAGNDEITVATKEDVPEVTKQIVEGSNRADVNEVSIGGTVNYEIKGTVSEKVESYKEYYYLFTDTLSKGLTLTDPNGDKTNDITVTIGNVDVTEYFTIATADYTGNNEADPYYGGTVITVKIANLLSLENIDADAAKDGIQPLVDIKANTEVVVSYSAELNKDAEIDAANPNKVDLTYSRDPYFESAGKPENAIPKGVTPEDEVKTYTTKVEVTKVIGGTTTPTPLPGAEFTITGDNVKIVIVTKEVFTAYKTEDTIDTANQYWLLNDGTYTTTNPATEGIDISVYANTSYYKKTVTEVKNTATGASATSVVDKDGYAAFTGLGAGTYTIEETKVPAGYNKAANNTVTITFNAATKKFSYAWNDGTAGEDNTVEIANYSGTELPSTGGMGTTLFYAVGGTLVLAAVVLLVTKKRMSDAE